MTTPDAAGAPGAARRVGARLGDLLGRGRLDLPLPGSGSTWARWRGLATVASDDLALARLVEGHLDAVAILAEAGRTTHAGCYGVFAARGPDSTVTARPVAGGLRLDGQRRYASGARVLDRALVDVDGPDGRLLVDLDLASPGVAVDDHDWQAVGMAASDTITVVLDDVVVPTGATVGPIDFYVRRPGFGHGGVGVAACWWGGAVGIVRRLSAATAGRPGGPRRRHLAAAAVTVRDLATVLRAAAHELDADPDDVERAAARATMVRAAVHRGCTSVLADCWAGGGTAACTGDHVTARLLADLPVYLTQYGGPPSLDALDPSALVAGLVDDPVVA